MRILPLTFPVLILAASCAPAPLSPAEEMDRLVQEAPSSPAAEAQLVSLGEKALPALVRAVRTDRRPEIRSATARILGRLYRSTGARLAVEAYVEALLNAGTPEIAGALMEQAHYFPDPDGQVIAIVTGALLRPKDVTAGTVRSAAALTDIEAMEPMMAYLSATHAQAGAPGRDIAARYLGRAARRGRMEVIDFFTRVLVVAAPELARLIEEELSLLAGKISVRSWRGWYLSIAKMKRPQWLAEAAGYVISAAFDPSDRAHIDRLIGTMGPSDELEPEFALIEPMLGKRFGYRSPRDVFDPTADLAELREANARSLATLKAWWKENAPFAWYDAASGRWEVNEEARQMGVPVDPKTGNMAPPK